MPRAATLLSIAILALFFASCGKKAEKLGVDVAITGTPTLTPTAPTSDDTITVQFSIGNIGTKSVGPVAWTAYFEDDPIATGTTAAIDPGMSVTGSFTLGNVQSGSHNITVLADSDGALREDNEANNAFTFVLPIIFAAPRLDLDFNPTTLTVTPSSPMSSNATITFGIRNTSAGSVAANNVHWHIFDGSVEIGSNTIASIPGNTTAAQSFNLVGTPGGTPGFHSITVVVDPSSAIHETDEGNNTTPPLTFNTAFGFAG